MNHGVHADTDCNIGAWRRDDVPGDTEMAEDAEHKERDYGQTDEHMSIY